MSALADGCNAGGIVGSFKNSETTVSRCLNLGAVTNSASGAEESVAGALAGASGGRESFGDCFYLDGSAKVAVGGKEQTDGCEAIESDAYAKAVETLGDAFRLKAAGEPVLRWTVSDSVFPVQFTVSYDTDANCADDYSVAYVLRSTGGGLGEEYPVSGSGSAALPRGSYHCIVSRVGYHDAEVAFTVQGSATEVPVELKAETYPLTVSFTPDAAALTLQNAAGETVAPVSSGTGSAA